MKTVSIIQTLSVPTQRLLLTGSPLVPSMPLSPLIPGGPCKPGIPDGPGGPGGPTTCNNLSHNISQQPVLTGQIYERVQ